MKNDFLAFVAEIMNVDISDISLETEYKVFEKWDSLMMMTLIMETEGEYGINIPIEKIGNIHTLKDLYVLTVK